MKKRLNYMFLFGLLLALNLASCGDDKEEAQTPAASLVVDNAIVTILQGDAITVSITSGNGDYAVKTFDDNIATATVSGEKITIQAPGNATLGETTILLTDGRKKSTTITAKVAKLWDLTIDNESPSMFIGESQTVKILSGNGGYTLALAEGSNEIIELGPLSGQVFTVKALKEGNATVIIKDKKDKTIEVNVEVKIVELELDKYEATLNGPGKTTDINILGGNGGYRFTYDPSGIATATEHQNVITISSVAVGTTTVTITDQKGATKDIEVTVLPKDIVTDVNTLTVTGTKASNTFSITDGNGGYAVASSNNNLMTATLSGSQVTVTAKEAGTGTITVTDAQGKTKQVTVTVNPAAMNLSSDYCLFIDTPGWSNNASIKNLNKITYEIIFYLPYSRGLQTFMGLEGNFLLRANEGGDTNRQFEISGPGLKLLSTQKIYTDRTDGPKPGKWYHLAVVFDGTIAEAKNRFKMYINGIEETLIHEKTSYPTTIDLTKTSNLSRDPGFMINRVYDENRPGYMHLYQASVWTTVRTSDQIRASMCGISKSDYTNPDLLMHWNFSDGIEANMFQDLTGKGLDAQVRTVKDLSSTTFPADRWVSSGCPQ